MLPWQQYMLHTAYLCYHGNSTCYTQHTYVAMATVHVTHSTTSSGVPGPVVSMYVKNIGITTVQLLWKPPRVAGTALTYDVKVGYMFHSNIAIL